MQVQLLGPMEIHNGGPIDDLTGAKRRALVAMLAIRPGQVLARETIAEELWDGMPPQSAVSTVKGYVSKIRKVLGNDVLRTAPAGYLLDLERNDVDATRFEDAVRWSMNARDEAPDAIADRLAGALQLWRGTALAEFRNATWARTEASRLEHLREAALELWIDARLELGEHAALVSETEALVVEFPLRERFWAQLMIALYRCGRQADALRAFARLRRLLAEELGIDPSRDLVGLETAILTQDASLEWSRAEPTNERAAAPTESAAVIWPVDDGVVSCTLMLTDIEGSTKLWEQHPDEMAVALSRHEEIIADEVRAAHGKLVKARGEGDSTFSVFRLATDAVQAATRIASALQSEAWPADATLRVRIAVHTGEVDVRDGDFYGVTVNRAARLRSIAVGGQVLLSAATSALVVDSLPEGTMLADLGLRPLRDLSRPEHIHELVDSGTPSPALPFVDFPSLSVLEWTTRRADGPFVGRGEQVKAMQAQWDTALVGRRQLVFVAGEPGVGKTRLAGHVAELVTEQGGLVLFGRWDEEPIAPFQGFLEALGAFADRCPPEILLEDVRSLAGDLAPLFPKLLPYGDVLPSAQISSDSERFRLFEAIDAWLRRIAARSPLLLVLDDLHWADRPALLLLRHLARSTASDRLMIVGAYRDTDVAPGSELADALTDLRRSAGFGRVDLTGFGVDDIDELVTQVTGDDVDATSFARALLAETSGNAFFLSEIVRHLADVGAFRLDAAEGRVPSALAGRRVPDGVREMVEWRVARLTPPCADLLRVASVIGAEFAVPVLHEVAGVDEETLLPLLEEAEASRLVRAGPRGDDQYMFEHAVVRHVLHDTLSSARRRRLHRQTGEVLERKPGVDPVRRRAALAYHFCEGADDAVAAKAVSYAREAGDDALAQLAFEGAAAHYGRAVSVLDRYGGDRLTRCELLIAAGEARNRAGESQIGKEDFAAAADVARSLGRNDLLVRAALGYGGELPASLEPDEQATELLEETLALGEHDDLNRARALGRLAQWIYFASPRDVRVAYCEEAVDLARAANDPYALATVLTSRCRALEGPEDLAGQLAAADEIIALGERLGDREVVLQGLRCRLHRVFEQGDFDGANALVDRMRELAGSLRSPEYLRLATLWDGLVAGTQGRFADASKRMGETVALMAGHPQMQRVLYFQALPWRAMQRRLADRVDLVAAAAAAEPRTPLWRALWAWFAGELGDLELAREQLTYIDFGLLTPARRRFDYYIAFSAMSIAIHRTEDAERAAALYEIGAGYAGRNCTAGQTAFCGAVDHFLGLLCATTGRTVEAISHLEAALARHEAMAAEPFVALTQRALADQLETAGAGHKDPARAELLRASAAATAERLGLSALLATPSAV
jgi:DNA-binding SARP family transcriptional activator